jgi:UPF0042 nucleotide-binding protein
MAAGKIRLVVLSGPSGAGKSTAIRVLEDMGFFCVDNLPVEFLPRFMELMAETGHATKTATVVDARGGEFLKDFPGVFRTIKRAGYGAELVYLEASDDTLLRRFSETRRRHPLSSLSPAEGIKKERALLREIKAESDRIIDTTGFSVHELKDFLRGYFSRIPRGAAMAINMVSFGYRYGIPADADIVMDVRFLPNPNFVDELKALDGKTAAVRKFVLSKKEAKEFAARFVGLLRHLVPLYRREGKSYLTIAVGCTGGRHRSVAIVEYIAGKIAPRPSAVTKIHRDIERG